MIYQSKIQLQLEALDLDLQLRIGVNRVLQNYFQTKIFSSELNQNRLNNSS